MAQTEAQRLWYLRNREMLIQRARDWKEKNKERKQELSRKRYQETKETVKKRSHDWYHSNKEKAAKRQRNWSKKNPEKHNAIRSAQRARKKKLTPTLSPEEKLLLDRFYLHATLLTKLLKIPHHVDHIIPLAKGGLHHPSNLNVIPASVNLRKGIK